MQYRRFGRLDWKVSALGFGAMRLPIVGNDRNKIDETEAIKMIRYAIDNGVNYVDTAYPYHGGNSETVVGKALQDGYREKVKLATKMPTWLVNSQADMDRFLEEQLAKLETDKIDFYLLHSLNVDRWSKMKELNVFEWADRALSSRRIQHVGFSFHDDYKVFKDIVDGYDKWTLCQIQYNYVDSDVQAGTKGLKYAASKGLAVVVMEPIAGGMIAFKPSKDMRAILDEAKTKRTPAEWALQWVWNHPEVSIALSGMNTMEQVIENVASAGRSGPKTLNKKELGLVSKLKKLYLESGFIACKDCKYCLPCPNGVEIPKIFSFYNEYGRRRGDANAMEQVKTKYSESIPIENRASQCAQCGECEEKCPQQLPIRDLLSKVAVSFEAKK